MNATSAYLEAARDAGALHDTGTGVFVAGGYSDRSRGVTQYLVTYCDDAAVRDGSLFRALPSVARADAPEAETVVVRLAPEVAPEAPWSKFVSYVRHAGKSSDQSEKDGVTIELADLARDGGAVRGWLADALAAAVTSQGDELPPEVPESIADDLIAAEGRRTYVARHRGEPIGHATLLCQEQDEVTGADFIELFDILVAPGHSLHRTAVRLLTEASLGYAAHRGLPLLGNVVHPLAGNERAHADRVVSSLLAAGWEADHVLWRCALGELADA
ncbi:hypothetical protein [Amycolatopsis sp. NPDC054798]